MNKKTFVILVIVMIAVLTVAFTRSTAWEKECFGNVKSEWLGTDHWLVKCEAEIEQTISMSPVQWTIVPRDGDIWTIFMIARVEPMTIEQLGEFGGSLVWNETTIELCTNKAGQEWHTGINIRYEGQGFLEIGDGFESNMQATDCAINNALGDAFDAYGVPDNACIFVENIEGAMKEYCSTVEEIPAEIEPTFSLTPVQWTIGPEGGSDPDVYTIFMIVDASPITEEQLGDFGGSLVWSETTIELCTNRPGQQWHTGINVRGLGENYLRIGDGFESNMQATDCAINNALGDAFDAYGVPDSACIYVEEVGGARKEYCSPLK
jgi:hypothetical protein